MFVHSFMWPVCLSHTHTHECSMTPMWRSEDILRHDLSIHYGGLEAETQIFQPVRKCLGSLSQRACPPVTFVLKLCHLVLLRPFRATFVPLSFSTPKPFTTLLLPGHKHYLPWLLSSTASCFSHSHTMEWLLSDPTWPKTWTLASLHFKSKTQKANCSSFSKHEQKYYLTKTAPHTFPCCVSNRLEMTQLIFCRDRNSHPKRHWWLSLGK